MKVKEAVAALLEQNQEAELVMASDAEGNSYDTLGQIGGTGSTILRRRRSSAQRQRRKMMRSGSHLKEQ